MAASKARGHRVSRAPAATSNGNRNIAEKDGSMSRGSSRQPPFSMWDLKADVYIGKPVAFSGTCDQITHWP